MARCVLRGANQTPYEQSWSFGFERQLPSNIVFNAEYIGKKGTHLPFSGFNSLNHLGPGIESLPITGPDADNRPARPSRSPVSIALWIIPSRESSPIPTALCPARQVQYSQLLLPHPQFTGVSTEPQLDRQLHLSRAAIAGREAVLERLAVPGHLHLVEIH